ncbi:Ig-like domain-containing protein [Alcanivorax xiamenensis]|nr:Ig-like domain-containing protein [Alcanivorax xiamenensis]
MPGNDANDSKRQSLLYAYPDDGQAEVPTKAPVVLRFTSDVSLGDVEQSVTLCCDAEGGNLDYTAETVGPDPRGVILTPAQSLSPLTDYTIAIKNLRLRNGTSADRTLRFTTRPLAEGPRSLVVKDDGFAIDRQMPNGDTNEPIMDFSSFRFQFTQPVDRASARYGDTVVLTDSSGATVEATLLINGHYMTVDPKPEYLTPGQSYTLSLTNGLTSTFDEAFAGTEISFTPADSSPRGEPAMLVQRITQSGLSRLTGKNINQVPVNGTLLGEDVNVTQASADAVVAELADVTEYPDVTPIRLPRGTKLTGSAIEMVMIGGEVPAGFGSGPVDMRLTSDASGYLVPNPYNVHNRADALRIVHLLMDVGIATEDPRANGGFTQDIMHIELVGVAEVDTEAGVLNLDAVGMVEPNILGQEYGYGLLSFQLQSYKDQMNAPTAPEDTTGPTLQSWTLGTDTLTGEDKSLLAKPGDPIILNFDEPIDPQSVEGNVTLYKTVNGGAEEAMPAQVYVDGAAIVVKPEEDLVYSPEEASAEYRLFLDSRLSDITGNQLMSSFDQSFSLARKISLEGLDPAVPALLRPDLAEYRKIENAPVILAAYPGFPCALEQEFLNDQGGGIDPNRDLQNDRSGLCVGGLSEFNATDATEDDKHPVDDIIPVMQLPANRPIIISFSKEIASDSVNEKTFQVDKVDANGTSLSRISGTLSTSGKTIIFTPSEPWEKSLYKYTLLSSGYQVSEKVDGFVRQIIADPNYTCGEDSVCDQSGLPIQTAAIGLTTISKVREPSGYTYNYALIPTGPELQAGGPDFVQFFRGTKNTDTVLQHLATEPFSDINHNFMSDRTNMGTAPFPPLVSSGEYLLENEEYGPKTPLLPSAPGYYPDYDPGALKPPPNSAKILSRYRNIEQDALLDQTTSEPTGIFGINLGCGFAYPATSDDGDPMACPEHKFSYLISSMFAEVTDELTPEGIRVKIWPSMVYGTGLDMYAWQKLTASSQPAPFPGATGKQILRMRYPASENAAPITGFISTKAGIPTLEVEVRLYAEAPFAAEYGISSLQNSIRIRSYPITMKMAGMVSFLDDGRMVVEQFNTNRVDILGKISGITRGIYGGYLDLFIPEYGSFLRFTSTPIKGK